MLVKPLPNDASKYFMTKASDLFDWISGVLRMICT